MLVLRKIRRKAVKITIKFTLALSLLVSAAAQSECVKKIGNPEEVPLQAHENLRMTLNVDLSLPRYNSSAFNYSYETQFQGGKVLRANRKIYQGSAMLLYPNLDRALPSCTLRYRLGQYSWNEKFEEDEKCRAMAERGEFCDFYEILKGHLKKGETMDLNFSTQAYAESCNGKMILPLANFEDKFKENLAQYLDSLREEQEDSSNAKPAYDTIPLTLNCSLPDYNPECKSITVQTLLDVFPPGSISVFKVDPTVDDCGGGQ